MERIIFEENNNRSVAIFDNNEVGYCEFEIKDNKWYIMHTVVLPEYGGRGIAKRLVLTLINEARKRNIKIVPICSYAVKMMIGNEEFKDVM